MMDNIEFDKAPGKAYVMVRPPKRLQPSLILMKLENNPRLQRADMMAARGKSFMPQRSHFHDYDSEYTEDSLVGVRGDPVPMHRMWELRR